MTTESKPQAGRRAARATPAQTPSHRSDQPYSSILEEDVDLSVEVGTATNRVRAPRISREEVFTTADALLIEGVRPTIDRVRMRLGRGSPNTINEFMDAWWAKLGSRLRDLPGREFPQLPDRVAASLRRLWNEALESAHGVLQGTLARREEEFADRTRSLDAGHHEIERERLAHSARTSALEEALALACTQLDEANHRARALEQTLEKRDAELQQLKTRATDAENRQEAERRSLLEERARLQDRYQASEARWLGEVDRARQQAKTADASVRELQSKIARAIEDRDAARAEKQTLRGELSTAIAVRQQLEARLEAARGRPMSSAPSKKARPASKKSAKASKKSTLRMN